MDEGVVLGLVWSASQQDVYFGKVDIGGYPTETVYPFSESIIMFLGEGPSVSRRFMMESFGCVMVEGGLHVGYPGVEGSGREPRPTYSSSCEHGVPDSGNMLVQQKLVTRMSSYDRVDGVAGAIVGACLAPPLTDEDGSVPDVGIGIG